MINDLSPTVPMIEDRRSADLPEKAMQISRDLGGEIAMLLTDVLMPGMNGRELAHRLRKHRPVMKVLYVSGFTDRAFENSGGPGPDEAFMEKPYSFLELARKIREML